MSPTPAGPRLHVMMHRPAASGGGGDGGTMGHAKGAGDKCKGAAWGHKWASSSSHKRHNAPWQDRCYAPPGLTQDSWSSGGQAHGGGGAPPEPGLPKESSGAYPEGHYVFCSWPILVARYPDKGQPGSWDEIKTHVTEDWGCSINLGGRKTAKRPNRAMGRLTIKGTHAIDAFQYVLKASSSIMSASAKCALDAFALDLGAKACPLQL